MDYRRGTVADAPILGAMNWQLIRDEGHRNPMTATELADRMAGWLGSEYEAVLFEQDGQSVGYALYCREPEYVYLRQFFVRPECRRQGIGREAIEWLRRHAWGGGGGGYGWRCWSGTRPGSHSGGRSGSATIASPWSGEQIVRSQEFKVMNCRTGLLCLLVMLALVGCNRTDTSPISAPADGTSPNARPIDVPSPAAATEFKKFEGTWVFPVAKIDGEDLPGQVGLEYTFAAYKLTIREGGRVLDTSRVVLDPSANPKAVDLVSDHLREGEPPARFIYEFSTGVLRLCRDDQERPTSFDGKEQMVFTLQRKKD